MFQAHPSNTGVVYLFWSRASFADDRTTMAKCIAVLPAPANALTGPFPAATFSMPNADTDLDLKEFWIDASANAQAVVVVGTHPHKEPYV
jgi:hypothetical protein